MWAFAVFVAIVFAAYLAFQTSAVQTYLVRQIAGRLSERLNTHISLKSVDIRFFNKVVLNDFLIEDQQQDTLLFVGKMVASIDSLSFRRHTVKLSSLEMQRTKIFVSLSEDQTPNYKFILDSLRTGQKKDYSWNFYCQNFLFSNTRVGYAYYQMEQPAAIDLHDIRLEVTDFALHRDSLAFQINGLTLDDHQNFHLSNLSARLSSSKNTVKLQNLRLNTPYSSISDADFVFDQSTMQEGKDISFLKLDVDLKESALDFRDVSQLIPSLHGMDMKINLSGRVFGTVGDLKAKNLLLEFGKNTSLVCDFYINGLPDVSKVFMMLDLKKSKADFKDLNKIRLPDSAGGDYLHFPQLLYEAGVVHYEGNFTGFLSDFVAYGTLNSNFGRLKTDLSFVPSGDDLLKVNGHLKTVNFKLGEFAKLPKFGRITFNGEVDGSFNKNSRAFNADIDGVVDSLVFNDYKFRKLTLNGAVQNKKFEGEFSVQDPNLDASFAGKVDFNAEVPVFDFEMDLKKADLKALNIDRRYEKSMLAFVMNANFTGNSIDNLDGNIWFEEGQYLNENDTVELKSLSVNTFHEKVAHLQFRSEFADADLAGNYSFGTIKKSFQNLVYRYLPSSGVKQDKKLKTNQFNFEVVLKNVEPLTKTFMPELMVGPAELTGRFDDSKLTLDLNIDIPLIEYKGIVFNGYSLSVTSGNQIEIKSRLEELHLNDDRKMYNLALLADAAKDRLNSKIIWNNFDEETYSGELETQVDFLKTGYNQTHVEIEVLPSKIYVADTLWTVHPSTITIDSTRVQVDGFKISNNGQQLTANGVVSKDKNDRLNMAIRGIDLANLDVLAGEDLQLKGVLSGTASVFDVYEKALFLSDLRINGLSFQEHLLGDVSLLSKWDRKSEAIHSELKINSLTHQSLYAFGTYTPATDSLDFTAKVNDLSLTILQPVLQGSFQNIKGRATGDLWIHGTPNRILMDGDVLGIDAGLALKALQVDYYFSDTVNFRSDSIIFKRIEITDYEGNKGIFNGSLRHDNYSNMDYDLSLRSSRLLAMNTSYRDNERFYGKAYAKGLLTIGGHGRDIYLNAAATSLSGTALNISLDYDEEAREYDFIQFINTNSTNEKPFERKTPSDQSKVYMNFDFEMTPDAQMQLVYNSQIGDVIRSRGNGNLQVNIDPDYNISIFGEYQVERGDYLFTLQNVINKKFEIARGGTIRWNGDPYDATINLDAIYRLKASLSELFASSMDGTGYDRVDYTQRIPVHCEIFLTENLNNPQIGFDIKLPMVQDGTKDQVRQFFSTDEDMNRQILSLLVLGRFYTPEYLRGSYEASNPNVFGTTASELFSNQLSNWLSQISNDFDFGFNYRPGNQMSDDEIELALSTQIFNDRVTINGNIGNNGSRTLNSNNNNIVGDFDMNVKLTNNGKLQLKAYNRSNNNLIYETSPYTQGIGVSFHENYDTFGELWRKFTRLFGKREDD